MGSDLEKEREMQIRRVRLLREKTHGVRGERVYISKEMAMGCDQCMTPFVKYSERVRSHVAGFMQNDQS